MLKNKQLGWSFVALALIGLASCKKSKEPITDEPQQKTGDLADVYAIPAPPNNAFDPAGKVREAAARMQCSNNLKQIGLAMHSYHDFFGFFPPMAMTGENPSAPGKPLLSWRVAILPYIEYDSLYKQFRLNEPWDSEHNKKLIPMMPKTYGLPGRQTPPGVTYFRLLVSDPKLPYEKRSLFDKVVPGMRPPRTSFTQITDGSSNTLMVITGGEGIIWTKPEELEYDPNQKIPAFGFTYANSCCVLLADGSVRTIQPTISEADIRGLITRGGGELLSPNW